MKISNIRNFVAALIATAITFFCIIILCLKGFDLRFVLSSILALALALVNFPAAFRHQSFNPEEDERDLHVAMKSGQKAFQFSTFMFFLAAMILLVLYAITANSFMLCVALTLILSSFVLSVVFLCALRYYEKHS